MTYKKLICIVLAAGHGTRMKSAMPKVLHEIAGRPMIGWVLGTISSLKPEKIIVVIGPDAQDVAEAVKPHETAIQKKPLGTGDALRAALPLLKNFKGDVLVLLGDMPLISTDTIKSLIKTRREGITVLGVEFAEPPPFGRLVQNKDGTLAKIVEDKDCTAEERKIKLCNAGAFCIDGAKIAAWADKIKNNNAQKEFYITDLVSIAADDGVKSHTFITAEQDEVRGVNTRADLAALEAIAQKKLRTAAMINGATMIDPGSVYLSWDTKLGQDVIIEPGVFFGPGVNIGDGVHIKAYSHLEGAAIGKDSVVGPFARLRPGVELGENCKIGNFVEIKNAVLGEGVKASHLGYIGDADIGDNVNFSCGAITVNYDGYEKHRTTIGDNAMIGSNVNLVAPVEIGAGAYIAAGSTITKDVPADALAVAREKPVVKDGWAAAKRKKKKTG